MQVFMLQALTAEHAINTPQHAAAGLQHVYL